MINMRFIVNIMKIPSRLMNFVLLKRKEVQYDTSLSINGRIRIHGNGRIILGENVRINSSEESNPIGGMERTIIASYGPGVISIGHGSGISNSAIVCHQGISIGNNVLIGGNTRIYDTDFHSLDVQKRGKGKKVDIPQTAPVVIEDNVFIGAHCIILKGVTIGENSIIGAGSVVTKKIPANQIWAGNPAKFIREVEKSNEGFMGN